LDKKNIFLANKNNDISNEIIKLINEKIKWQIH
jgi:Skp family chaperone for outer membrane proteins